MSIDFCTNKMLATLLRRVLLGSDTSETSSRSEAGCDGCDNDFGIYGLSVVTGHVDTRSFGFQNDFSRVCNAREVSLRILANGEFRSDLPRRPRFRSTHDNLMIINGYGGNSSRRFGNPWERQWKPSQRD